MRESKDDNERHVSLIDSSSISILSKKEQQLPLKAQHAGLL
jgi:hypothetical protein